MMKEYKNNDGGMNTDTYTRLLCAGTALSLSQACTHFVVTATRGGWVPL